MSSSSPTIGPTDVTYHTWFVTILGSFKLVVLTVIYIMLYENGPPGVTLQWPGRNPRRRCPLCHAILIM